MVPVLRPMTGEDWPQAAAIYRQALEEGRSTFQTLCPSWEEWDRGHLPVCRLAAEEAGRLAGWCALSPTSSRECYRGVAEVSIYLDRAFRGRGVGRMLLERLCAQSEKEGIWSLYAAVFAQNQASIRLFRSCGFREIGYRERIARDRFGQWQNTVLLERRSPTP